MRDKCSISLHTRVRDTRNLIANLSHYLDSTNISYKEEDKKKKCEIFELLPSRLLV